MVKKEINEPNNENPGNESDKPGLKQQIKNFTKTLIYGSSDRHLISLGEHTTLSKRIDTVRDFLRTADKTLKQYGDTMWDKGVNPRDFNRKLKKSYEHYQKLHHQNKKLVTKEDINDFLSQWNSVWDARQAELSGMIEQLNKSPQDLQTEAQLRLPQLVEEAKAILEKLNSKDWKQIELQDEKTRKKLNRLKSRIERYVEKCSDNNKKPKKLSKFSARLEYSNQALSKIIATGEATDILFRGYKRPEIDDNDYHYFGRLYIAQQECHAQPFLALPDKGIPTQLTEMLESIKTCQTKIQQQLDDIDTQQKANESNGFRQSVTETSKYQWINKKIAEAIEKQKAIIKDQKEAYDELEDLQTISDTDVDKICNAISDKTCYEGITLGNSFFKTLKKIETQQSRLDKEQRTIEQCIREFLKDSCDIEVINQNSFKNFTISLIQSEQNRKTQEEETFYQTIEKEKKDGLIKKRVKKKLFIQQSILERMKLNIIDFKSKINILREISEQYGKFLESGGHQQNNKELNSEAIVVLNSDTLLELEDLINE